MALRSTSFASAQAPRAEGGRDFRHLLGRAIGVSRSPNIDCVHPCDSVVGSPWSPQLQADTGCPQQQVGTRRRDGEQRGTGNRDRRTSHGATTLPSDTSCPKPHDMPHPKMLVARFATLCLCGFPEHDRGINFPNRLQIKTACKSIDRSVAKTMNERGDPMARGVCGVTIGRPIPAAMNAVKSGLLIGWSGELIRHKQK